MKTGVAALFAAFIAVELLNKAGEQVLGPISTVDYIRFSTIDSQTERCGYIRGIVRLRGGQHEREGRVQVCNNDQWGQLCGNGWDSDDAVVVCRQLGLLSADTGEYNSFVVTVAAGLIPVATEHIELVWTAQSVWSKTSRW